jgi:phosphatidylglycerol:prolipoprotein diacylglycerol transferase
MIVALLLFFRFAKVIKFSQDDAITLFLIVVPSGIVGARVGYIVSHPEMFFPLSNFDDFLNLFAIWTGGVTIIGGIALGFLSAFLYAKKKKINMFELMGAASIPLLLAQAIGRWGNFFNQELYGTPVGEGASNIFRSFPFGVYIEAEGGWFYSAVFFESILSFIGAGLLYLLFRKSKYKGTIFFGYLAWYFLSRALVESIRVDALYFPPFPLSLGVIISVVIIPIAVLLGIIYYMHGSLKKLTFKKAAVPEAFPEDTEESDGEISPNIAANENAIAEKKSVTAANANLENKSGVVNTPPKTEREKTADGKLADYKRKFYANKKKK